MVQITLNGAAHTVPANTTLETLLIQLNPAGKRVAVERNGEIVPRSLHATTVIAAHDRLEIVIAVGGG